MYNLKNLQSIVIKKAEKGSIGIVSDKKDYRMEREKNFTLVPLSSLKLFMMLLKKDQRRRSNIFLVTFQIILMQKILSLVDFIYCLKFIKGYMTYQEDQKFLNVAFIQRMYLLFQCASLNLLLWKLSHISKILLTVLKNSETSKINQKIL